MSKKTCFTLIFLKIGFSRKIKNILRKTSSTTLTMLYKSFVEKASTGQIEKIYLLKDNQLFIIIIDEDMAKIVVNNLPESDSISATPHDDGGFNVTFLDSNNQPVTISSTGEIISSDDES